MKYSLKVLNTDLTRLQWLLSNDKGNDVEYTEQLKSDILDLQSAIKILIKL
jgi:septum formation topological specificity factor MinE